MNGYGGRMQEVDGKFSANRDRGVLVPKKGVPSPDLSYIRHAAEPELVANAVGRRVDGKLNEYTKIYPEAAAAITLQLPITSAGKFDYRKMEFVGAKIRRIEAAKALVRAARTPLAQAAFALAIPEPTVKHQEAARASSLEALDQVMMARLAVSL